MLYIMIHAVAAVAGKALIVAKVALAIAVALALKKMGTTENSFNLKKSSLFSLNFRSLIWLLQITKRRTRSSSIHSTATRRRIARASITITEVAVVGATRAVAEDDDERDDNRKRHFFMEKHPPFVLFILAMSTAVQRPSSS